jgi:hypothetical protein
MGPIIEKGKLEEGHRHAGTYPKWYIYIGNAPTTMIDVRINRYN